MEVQSGSGDSLDTVFTDLEAGNSAVVVADDAGRPVGVLTRADLLEYLAHNPSANGAG